MTLREALARLIAVWDAPDDTIEAANEWNAAIAAAREALAADERGLGGGTSQVTPKGYTFKCPVCSKAIPLDKRQ